MNSTQSSLLISKIQEIILTDYSRVMLSPESPISKFILIAVGIEFLGACIDKQHMNSTARSEKRFNLAIQKLFPKKYHHFTKMDSVPNLYKDFRCPILHQFKSGNAVSLYSKTDIGFENFRHLEYNSVGSLNISCEDIYQDLTQAALSLIKSLRESEETKKI